MPSPSCLGKAKGLDCVQGSARVEKGCSISLIVMRDSSCCWPWLVSRQVQPRLEGQIKGLELIWVEDADDGTDAADWHGE